MHPQTTKNQFIELRAQGWSLGHIATELNVSKRTLVDWNREFAQDVQSLRALELELLKEKILASHEENLNRLTRLQKDIDDELANRTLKFVDTEKLFRLSIELRQEIERLVRDKDSQRDSSHLSANGVSRGTIPATIGTPQS